jgi:hypothetical protein
MTQQSKQPRERKQVNKLILHDSSCSPDHRFMQRLVELGLPGDIEILNAWSPRPLIETTSLR